MAAKPMAATAARTDSMPDRGHHLGLSRLAARFAGLILSPFSTVTSSPHIS
jgi:hypothetical protein